MSEVYYSGTRECPSIKHKEAADLMRTATSVPHWNELRKQLKEAFPIEVQYWIDQSGLIVEVVT